jgi:hypothetical protein
MLGVNPIFTCFQKFTWLSFATQIASFGRLQCQNMNGGMPAVLTARLMLLLVLTDDQEARTREAGVPHLAVHATLQALLRDHAGGHSRRDSEFP